jgi:hypothetical protein
VKSGEEWELGWVGDSRKLRVLMPRVREPRRRIVRGVRVCSRVCSRVERRMVVRVCREAVACGRREESRGVRWYIRLLYRECRIAQ